MHSNHIQTKHSYLGVFEDKFINAYVSRLHHLLHTHHLTYLSHFLSFVIVGTFYLATFSLQWLWLTNLLIFLRYLSDAFDGALGRFRHTGLVNWGFYMDHLGDYLVSCFIIGSYLFIAPPSARLFLILSLITIPAFWFHAALLCNITHNYRTSYGRLSPTELSLIVILLNICIISFGVSLITPFAILTFIICTSLLIFTIVRTDRFLWKLDKPYFPEDHKPH